jgi:hypothetical protein
MNDAGRLRALSQRGLLSMAQVDTLFALLDAEAKEHARLRKALEAIERRNPAGTVLREGEDPSECAECGRTMQLREDAEKDVSHICDTCAQEIAGDVLRIAFVALHQPETPSKSPEAS